MEEQLTSEERKKLISDNHNLIYSYLNKNNLPIEEYYGVAAIGLVKAGMTYDQSISKFSTYAITIINNEVLQEKRRRHSLKREYDIHVLYYEDNVFKNIDDGSEYTFLDTIKSVNNIDENYICTKKVIDDFIEQKLHGRNKDIFIMQMNGYSQSTIADKYNITNRRVNIIVNDIRKKLAKALMMEGYK